VTINLREFTSIHFPRQYNVVNRLFKFFVYILQIWLLVLNSVLWSVNSSGYLILASDYSVEVIGLSTDEAALGITVLGKILLYLSRLYSTCQDFTLPDRTLLYMSRLYSTCQDFTLHVRTLLYTCQDFTLPVRALLYMSGHVYLG